MVHVSTAHTFKLLIENKQTTHTHTHKPTQVKGLWKKITFEIHPGRWTEFDKSSFWGQSLQIKETDSTKYRWQEKMENTISNDIKFCSYAEDR